MRQATRTAAAATLVQLWRAIALKLRAFSLGIEFRESTGKEQPVRISREEEGGKKQNGGKKTLLSKGFF